MQQTGDFGMSKKSNKFIAKLYLFTTSVTLRKYIRGVDSFLQKLMGKGYDKTFGRLKYRLRYEVVSKAMVVSEDSFEDICWNYELKSNHSRQPLVSIIVPNYNHAKYLEQRLDAIYGQTYSRYEVILLDDCSTDNSREILDAYAKKHSGNTRVCYNETNCGRIFEQWNRGMRMARGELIWIAESDDYCEKNFLEEMVKLFAYDSVRLAFARSVFTREGEQIWTTEEYLHDLVHFRWDKPFYMTAHNMVRFGFAQHNMIPNVSSAVFRNTGDIRQETITLCSNMKLSGDWIFYLSIMQGGVAAYTNATTNYYRIHNESTSLKIQEEDRYYTEFAEVSKYVVNHYTVEEGQLQKNLEMLREHYKMHHPEKPDTEIVQKLYPIEEIKGTGKPHVALACYALRSGGAETYPIYLANEMCRQGYPVTLLNFNTEQEEERIRELVDRRVPLVTLKNRVYVTQALQQLGIDIVHTHNTCVDELVANALAGNTLHCRHVISLHGMYESIAEEDCDRAIRSGMATARKYIYIADKNLEPFRRLGIPIDRKFIKMPNGVPDTAIQPVKRSTLGIGEDAFVFVLASRGLPEKGWKEAITSVKNVNTMTDRPVHLVILGDGPVMEEARRMADEHIHLQGTVSNVSDYFAMGDMGLLPTCFAGESYPLSVAECLKAGKPVMATEVAEIPNQLKAENGELAGILINRKDGKADVQDMTEKMLDIVTNRADYEKMSKQVQSAAVKFDLSAIVQKHYEIYQEVMNEKEEVC